MPTHGTISYVPSGPDGRPFFRLNLDPDVRMRVKRILPKVSTKARSLIVTANDDTAADLAMIAGRWDLEMDEATRDRIIAGDIADRERAKTVEAILSGEISTNPNAMEAARPLRPYQAQAHAIATSSGGLLLADELGLGKTASALSSLGDPAMRPMLVVTQTGLTRQWVRELKKIYPDLTAHEVTKGTPYEIRKDGAWPDMIAMNYAKLAGWAAHLDGKVRSVVFDEVQELRRTGSQKYQAAQLVVEGADLVWGLSGTPVMNYGGEMFSIMSILAPDALGSSAEFQREWCEGGSWGLDQKARVNDPDALGAYLRSRGSMLRRTRTDVNIDLPPVTIIEQPVSSDRSVIQEAETNVAEIARLVLDMTVDKTERMKAGGEMDWKMRQATGIAKAPHVADFARLILESEEKVILFGWHRAVIDIWKERLAPYGVVLYTGSETPAQKARSFDAFRDGSARVLVLSLRSGAGIDGLQDVCRNIIFGEYDWSPGVHKQGIGRIHRPGQTEPTFVYFCDSGSGSDPAMLDVLSTKTMEADLMINPDQTSTITDPKIGQSHRQALAASILARAKATA